VSVIKKEKRYKELPAHERLYQQHVDNLKKRKELEQLSRLIAAEESQA
jgi:hypothetical protein